MQNFSINNDILTVYDDKGNTETISVEKEKIVRQLYINEKKSMRETAALIDVEYKKFLFIKRALGITRKSSTLSLGKLKEAERDGLNDEEILIASTEDHYYNLENQALKNRHKLIEKTLAAVLQNNKTVADIADLIKDIPNPVKETITTSKNTTKKDGLVVIPIADLHYGIDIESYLNTMNPTIMAQNIEDVTKLAIEYIEDKNPETVLIVGMGDLIHGLIHTGTRINSIKVNEQVAQVSHLLATLINTINASTSAKVFYSDVYGNHGRFMQDIKKHRTGENFEYFITEFIRLMTDVDFAGVDVDGTTKAFVSKHLNMVYSHDGGRNVKAVGMAQQKKVDFGVDLVLMAHYHSDMIRMEGKHTLVSVCPTLAGSDDYAQDNNYISEQKQTFMFWQNHHLKEQVFEYFNC